MSNAQHYQSRTTSEARRHSSTTLTNSVPDPSDNNSEDIDHFASFMRSLKAPARDESTAANSDAKRGAELFTKMGCAICHKKHHAHGLKNQHFG
jgi:cytochrome c peroxidase